VQSSIYKAKGMTNPLKSLFRGCDAARPTLRGQKGPFLSRAPSRGGVIKTAGTGIGHFLCDGLLVRAGNETTR
jgi:hypothetical protein